jgi:ZIP family zinc transporter
LGTTLLLGFIAGVTIVLGLPLGRLRRPAPGLRAFLNAVAVGILLFLVWDVLSAAWKPIDSALGQVHDGHGGAWTATGYGLTFAAGLAVGLLGLVAYERWMSSRASRAGTAGGAGSGEPMVRFGPGSMQAGELPARGLRGVATWSAGRRLALMIAVGIGLHNFAEGLAIGQSAARSEIALATLLVIGFGLHNATEGFGIVAPLSGDLADDGRPARPSWGFLLALGLIGGAPTFLGTVIGHSFTSEPVAVVFLTLAAGSIIYVITQLLGVAAKTRRGDLLAYGLILGLLAGFGTDAIVSAAGA